MPSRQTILTLPRIAVPTEESVRTLWKRTTLYTTAMQQLPSRKPTTVMGSRLKASAMMLNSPAKAKGVRAMKATGPVEKVIWMDCITVESTVRMMPSTEFLDSSHTAIMTPMETTTRQATSALEGTLCSMHTAKSATHTGTEARITWRGRTKACALRASRCGRRGQAGGLVV